jgi:hypothetical protein
MKASDLRIGNWIIDYEAEPNKTIYWQVETIEYLNTTLGVRFRNKSSWTCEEFIEPIPLTEEWLLKFGGRKTIVEDYPIYFVNPFDIEFYKNESVVLISGNTEVKIKYVHQLQNLYFALTGEELTFK